jgi:chemotaxis protein histidine kinase CheA
VSLFPIKDIQPNPFRHLERYPIRRDKIDALKDSYRSTGVWPVIIARLVDGKPQIAFGHHRLQAALEEFGPDHRIELIIQDIDDDGMIKRMAAENMQEWESNAVIEQETIRAVVQAFAEGLIHLPTPTLTPHMQVRVAPSFTVATGEARLSASSFKYTLQTLTAYIGWSSSKEWRVGIAMNALELIEEGYLTDKDFDGLATRQAREVVEQARRVKDQREREAREAEAKAKAAAEQAEKARIAQEKAAAEAEAKREAAAKAKAAAEAAEAERKARAEQARQAREAEAAAKKAKQAEEAERQRKAAAEAQKKADEEAAKAKAERATQAAAEAAQKAAQKQADAQAVEQQQATQVQQQHTAQAAAKRQEARTVAKQVGQGVSRAIKDEKRFRVARKVAEEIDPKPEREKPRPRLEEFTTKLMAGFDKFIHDDEQRMRDLYEVLRFKQHLSGLRRREAATTLRSVGRRLIELADLLEAPAETEIVAAVVADDRMLTDQR